MSWKSSLAWVVVGCGLACGRPPAPSIVRIGVDVDAGSLDPRLMRDTTAYRVVNLLYDGLVQLDPSTLKPTPGLAERWENPNPKTWIFHLREDARFHDGAPVRAADAVYTFETLLDPELKAPLRSLYTPVDRVVAVDPLTVRFELDQPYAPLLSYLDIGIVPEHLVEAGRDLSSQPVGSGPYRLKRWDRGSKIVLEAYPDFWGGRPHIDTIELVLVPDNTARAQAFEAGDLDVIMAPLSPRDIRRLTADERFQHDIRPGLAITYLNFNTRREPLNEPAMRRALAMLIDQDTILSRIYEETDEAASSVLLPAWWVFDETIRQPDYDPESAGELLSRLGWSDRDGDGVLDKHGKKLTLELGTHSEDVNRIQTLEFLQNSFTRAGVETRVWISDWPSFSVRRDTGDYEILLLGWTQLVDPDRVTYDQFHSRGGLNWGGYANREVDRLLETGRSSADPGERADVYRRAASILATEVPYYVLSYQNYQVFYSLRLQGFEPDPRGMMRSLTRATLAN